MQPILSSLKSSYPIGQATTEGLMALIQRVFGRRKENEHELTRKIKNEFMVNWDGLRTKDTESVLVLAATNRPFDLDEAAIRRMPRRCMVDLPDTTNRSKILKVILAKEKLSDDFDFNAIAHITDGFSGSDLKLTSALLLPITRSKRRAGPFKKATELSILCGAHIAIIIFSLGGLDRDILKAPGLAFQESDRVV
ncbi:hypothetical protein CASFOL_013931 [Castilleja foliolosa]|uniref:MADS-box domain-containing protein n=1 Tax=Castilleja foliolosa TaxID=1961234 RepID=A0ABD3DLG0_9LAMI